MKTVGAAKSLLIIHHDVGLTQVNSYRCDSSYTPAGISTNEGKEQIDIITGLLAGVITPFLSSSKSFFVSFSLRVCVCVCVAVFQSVHVPLVRSSRRFDENIQLNV